MQAVILVGGEGTRLRPLTSTVPKPVVPLVDRPFIAYMLEWLARHGVDDVVMSCGFLATACATCSATARSTGCACASSRSPSRAARPARSSTPRTLLDERFLMLNGDVLTDIDLTAQIAQHEATGAVGTLALVPVADPTAYGLVRLHDDHAVKRVRREAERRPDRHEPHLGRRLRARAPVLDLIPPDRNVSIEREVWPRLVGEGLFGFAADAYWLDIGTPERYLQGTFDILEGNVARPSAERLGRRLPGRGRARAGRRAASSRRRSSSAAADRGAARTSARSSCSATA